MAKKTKRIWHPVFQKYMSFIINHPNYRGMPFPFKENGEVRWITSVKSDIGKARYGWWDEKRIELKMPKGTAWISKVARVNHPTGEKPCQICGKVMKLDYIYPNKKSGFSPGAMSNAPDRLDGFHSYNLCCRSKQDKGRHKSNMARYGEDRRAYENWSDGNWKAASWLMKEFQKHGVSPDHLGPISLGFSHRPKFRPLTIAANSARNNRMTHEDVKLLLQEEMVEQIVSTHSKYIWNQLKNKVQNDEDALKLGKLMRENMHHVLSIFSYLAENGCKKFLIKNFLHPEHANFSIKFESFDPKTGNYTKQISTPGTKKQYANNAKRYIRISLESLKQYSLKKNRNLKKWLTDETEENLSQVLKYLKDKDDEKALAKLFMTFEAVAEHLSKKFNQSA
jgi:hypothetical protein